MGRGSEIAIGLTLLLGATAARCGVHPYLIDPANCRAPALDHELEASLCEADKTRFETRVRALFESRDPEVRRQTILVLERVWQLDPTLGRGLPLKALDRGDFRVVVAEFLAQAIRSGKSNEPLSNLQDFAAAFFKSHRDDDCTSAAVETAGVTDSISLLPLVIQTIESNAGGARQTAILALGDMCSPRAEKFLVRIQAGGEAYSEEDKRVAGLAIKQRTQGMPASWCKKGLPSTTR